MCGCLRLPVNVLVLDKNKHKREQSFVNRGELLMSLESFQTHIRRTSRPPTQLTMTFKVSHRVSQVIMKVVCGFVSFRFPQASLELFNYLRNDGLLGRHKHVTR